MPVWVYATDDAAGDAGLDERHVHLVAERGAKIVHRAQFEDSSFVAAIEAALAR